jgi:poly-gamma-glutamate synthesis protein (capsule biosynthesis protein)
MQVSLALNEGYKITRTLSDAKLIFDVDRASNPSAIQWVYTLVAPFPTIEDGVTADELRSAWNGEITNQLNGNPLLMDESTMGVLTAFWGAPGAQAVHAIPANELLDYAWSNRPSWAIVPFDELDPRWKALTIDGQSPIRKEFDPSTYLLTVPFAYSDEVINQLNPLGLPITNREASKLTTVAMTGVTAMVRATAFSMEQEGVTYPAQDIGPLLAQADITHISNEIPFSPDCPFPTPTMESLVFCSNPKYIDLLKAVGTDIVELTGDHFMDYGAEATLYTLQMYKDLGWPYYGGGANAKEARQPVKLENNGNKIAFMGCNVGCQVKNEIPCDAIATDTHPGAAQCDFNYINTEIPALRDEGYQVIFTFQHREYYTYTTEPILADDFGLVAAAGATIVSGSQAHQPHGFAFENESFIHYGLGNLFFDQYHYCVDYACDDAFIDRHVFYAGRYISTELITIRFVDFARPRLMTPEERAHILEIIFNASDW